jgi:putative Holliday junction resolvase
MGRILALDFGLKRVGAAISDTSQTFASPLETYTRQSDTADARHYRALVEDEAVERIVIGLPVHTTGRESTISTQARAWGAWLQKIVQRPIVYFDERFTSSEAEQTLLDAGLRGRALKSRRDMLAAQILLQAYIEAGCPKTSRDPQPLDDVP